MESISNIYIPSEGLQLPGDERVVEIKDLHIAFGSTKVLRGLNLVLHKGENLVVMGKSGSGKSVLIKCMVRLLDADKGSIEMFGKDIEQVDRDELNEMRKKMGFLFQSAALYDSMTVKENLEFPLRNEKNLAEAEINKRITEALENVGLREAANKMPSELSGGMRKRIGLARTLIMKPQIILYDEPTTGLDPVTAREISELIVKVQSKYETSGIIITHDLECARITSNRVVMLKDGKCYAEGTFDELRGSDNKWVHSFFE